MRLDQLTTVARQVLAVLDRDGAMPPSKLRQNYDFSEDLGGGAEVPSGVREVLNIDAAIKRLTAAHLVVLHRDPLTALVRLVLTPEGYELLHAEE